MKINQPPPPPPPLIKHEDIITLENNQIQISPEFHQFLYKFIDNYQNSYLDEKLQQLENLMIYKNYKIMLKN